MKRILVIVLVITILSMLSVLASCQSPAQGAPGEPGVSGQPGEKGDSGEQGIPGEPGEPGESGAQGEKGDKGEPGAVGDKGDKGDQGDPGPAGEKGDAGNGILKVEILDGCLWITYTDDPEHPVNLGKLQGDSIHDFSDWILPPAGSGLVQRFCRDCGYTESYYVCNGQHLPGEWIQDTEATCTVNGTGHRVCSVCGEIAEEGTTPKLSHLYQDGVCTVCGHRDGLVYMLSETLRYLIFAGMGDSTDTEIFVAAAVDGLPVVAVGARALENCDALAAVSLPSSINQIGAYAFSGCKNLKTLSYGGTVSQWEKVEKDPDWNVGSALRTVVCSDGTVTVGQDDTTDDTSDRFATKLSDYLLGTPLENTDLVNFFSVYTPTVGSLVDVRNGRPVYHLTPMGEMYADMNGHYSFRVNNVDSGSRGWIFVRGYQVVDSADAAAAYDPATGYYRVHHYYEMDGDGYLGGAGIYARITDGRLYILIKSYDSSRTTRIGNNIYSLPCEGDDITIADDGKTVSILVGDRLYAQIELTGTTVYSDLEVVRPRNTFAEKAVLTLADGRVETIENTLVADTCMAQIGIMVRADSIRFTALQVGAYAEVTIPDFDPWEEPEETQKPDDPTDPTEPEDTTRPEEPTTPVEPEEPTTPVEPEETTCPEETTAPDEPVIPDQPGGGENLTVDLTDFEGQDGYAEAWGTVVPVPHVKMNHGVTIYLGQVDLSQYSAVRITYCCDGSEFTEAEFEASSSLAIGLKRVDSSYGQGTTDDFSGDIAHTDMVFSNVGYFAGARDAVVDLSDVTYNGNVWVALHNPANTMIVITGIEFIAG